MLSVCIITKNEEKNLRECLESARFADETVIVDSGSTDKTLEIAKEFTSNISFHPFRNFAEQKNKVLSLAKGGWIFLIDADERISPELAAEIKAIAAGKPDAVYQVKRRTYFLEKPLSFSGTQGDSPIRLFPRGMVSYEQPVHEQIVTELPVKRLHNLLLHMTTRSMAQYEEKLDLYTRLEVETMKQKGRTVSWADLWLAPAAKFLYLYFFQLGILDGVTGFRFAFLSAYYHWTKCKKFLSSKK